MARLPHGKSALVAWLFVITPALALSPYIPTRILLSKRNQALAYVFHPSSSSKTSQLSTLDLSSSIDLSNPPYDTLYSRLPFLRKNEGNAFTPVIDHAGNISVLAGDCNAGPQGAEIWRYYPGVGADVETGHWDRDDIETSNLNPSTSLAGSNYLATGFAFSSDVKGSELDTTIYVFGGMCPKDGSTLDTWTSAADYSDFTLTLTPKSKEQYDLGSISSETNPIAEAGSSITALGSTYINSDGKNVVQQQNFVMIGGHTESAFINMSQIALFSLPEQTWAFIDVDAPRGHTDLAVRTDSSSISPRSGHTAVLSQDGKSIIVFGGWVGDIDTPADPQMAILKLGEGYGGTGEWGWTTPFASGEAGPSETSGIYGHGAAMLSNGVMMILGGYTISSDGKSKRDAQNANQRAFFFDTNTNMWLTDYQPIEKTAKVQSDSSSEGLSSTAEKAGLGVGITLGCIAIIAIGIFFWGYRKRSRQNRQRRETHVREMSEGQERLMAHDLTGGVDGRGGSLSSMRYIGDTQRSAYWTRDLPDQSSPDWKQRADRSGALIDVPSPTRGLRRSNARGGFHSGHRYSNIQPIDEQDEDEQAEQHPSPSHKAEMVEPGQGETEHLNSLHGIIASTAAEADGDTASNRSKTGGRNSPSRQSPTHTRDWATIRDQASQHLNAGRVSPSKSERTSSTLSTLSQQSAMLVNPFETPQHSPTNENPPTLPDTPDAPSYRTARTSFLRLQAEGENLLGSSRPNSSSASASASADSPTRSRHSTQISGEDDDEEFPDRPDKNRSPSTRISAWLPGARRLLGLATGSSSNDSRTKSLTSTQEKRHTLGYFPQYAPLQDRYDSPSNSAVPSRFTPSPTLVGSIDRSNSSATAPLPRRAASDASSTWMKKQRGAKDWGVGVVTPSADEELWRRNSGDDWGAPEDRQEREVDKQSEAPSEDWDVEAAVEGRVVQVMFTVPRTRLRVVNAEEKAREDSERGSVDEKPERVE